MYLVAHKLLIVYYKEKNVKDYKFMFLYVKNNTKKLDFATLPVQIQQTLQIYCFQKNANYCITIYKTDQNLKILKKYYFDVP